MAKLRSGDISGAVADLGVLVPLVAALVLVNGMDPGGLLLWAGALSLAAGLYFKVPFPVQPLKALTALAVAQTLSPEVIHAAGLEIGVLLVVMSVTGLADRLAVLFTKPVIRSLQFAVGSLLVVTAVKLAADPPEVFATGSGSFWTLALAGAVAVVVAIAAKLRWNPAGALIMLAGIVIGWVMAAPDVGFASFHLPDLGFPSWSVFGTAFVLLVIPQIPLTYGNAIVGVSDLAREHFGEQAEKVAPRSVAMTCGLGNVVSALAGGMPMCHGSSGLSAHVRLGARTKAMNVMLGTALIALGVFYSEHLIALFGVLPVWALAGFLAYAGLRHALLVLDLRGVRLAVALVAGILGVATGNLAITTGVAIAAEFGGRLVTRRGRSRSHFEPQEVP